MKNTKPQEAIEGEVLSVLSLQKELAATEAKLEQMEVFKKFIELRKSVNDKMASIRTEVKAIMIPAYQKGQVDKTIKGDWGSVTVTVSDTFKIDEATLQPKFWKKIPDETKIRATYQLEGKSPKGTEHSKTYNITMKFK